MVVCIEDESLFGFSEAWSLEHGVLEAGSLSAGVFADMSLVDIDRLNSGRLTTLRKTRVAFLARMTRSGKTKSAWKAGKKHEPR